MEKEVVIALRGSDLKEEMIDSLSRDTTHDSSVDSSIVPDRAVHIENQRPSSKKLFTATLTEEEVSQLRQDGRVEAINSVPVWDNSWTDNFHYGMGKSGDSPSTPTSFSRVRTTLGGGTSWGIRRLASRDNPWFSLNTNYTQSTDLTSNLTFTADGTGVDYINHEGGLVSNPTDPQWFSCRDSSINRYKQFQWNTLPNCSGIQTITYTASANWSDHATAVCAFATSQYYGVARNANIYSFPINLITSSYWFDAIKEFHRAKAVDPITGFKAPTVVNASWGTPIYLNYWDGTNDVNVIQSLNFRGSTISGTSKADFSDVYKYALGHWQGGSINRRYIADLFPTMKVEVQEMIDEGIIFISSAGNNGQLIDAPTGLDWNNTVTTNSQAVEPSQRQQTYYYCRGSSNTSNDSIEVGAVWNELHPDLSYAGTKEHVTYYSCKGEGVHIYAPGSLGFTGWDGASANVAQDSFGDGTSYAAPLVSGIVCQLVQLSPGMSCKRVKEWIVNNGTQNALFDNNHSETNTEIRWSDEKSLFSGNNVVAYNPFLIAQDNDVFTNLYNISNNAIEIVAT